MSGPTVTAGTPFSTSGLVSSTPISVDAIPVGATVVVAVEFASITSGTNGFTVQTSSGASYSVVQFGAVPGAPPHSLFLVSSSYASAVASETLTLNNTTTFEVAQGLPYVAVGCGTYDATLSGTNNEGTGASPVVLNPIGVALAAPANSAVFACGGAVTGSSGNTTTVTPYNLASNDASYAGTSPTESYCLAHSVFTAAQASATYGIDPSASAPGRAEVSVLVLDGGQGPTGNTVAISMGTGAFRCSGTVKATMASSATATVGAPASRVSVAATQRAALAALSEPVRAALTVNAIAHADTVGITARLAPFVVNATAYARNAVAAEASVQPSARIAYRAAQAVSMASRGSFSANFTITQTNKPPLTVAITARVGGFRVAVTEQATAHAAVSTVVDKSASAIRYTSASHVHAMASMRPRVMATYASRTANAVKALLRPLTAFLRVFPPLASLPADPRYYIALPYRAFLVQLAQRTFYAAGDTMQAFPVKNPSESFVLTFDATPDLANGETLSEITGAVVMLVYGTDPDPSNILGTPIINAAAVTIPGKNITVAANCGVQVVASGGFASTGYAIAITCTTSNPDKILTLTGMLPVGVG